MMGIGAGAGGARWRMLELLLERTEGSAVALATSMWLYEAWEPQLERDEVRDVIWRTWRELGEVEEATRWVHEAVCEAKGVLCAHGVEVSDAWRGYLGAALLWAWRVSTRRHIPWERVSVEVDDGVVWPGKFVKSLPGTSSANDLSVGSYRLLAGASSLQVRHGHEPGHWVVSARMMSAQRDVMSFSGEMCQALIAQLQGVV